MIDIFNEIRYNSWILPIKPYYQANNFPNLISLCPLSLLVSSSPFNTSDPYLPTLILLLVFHVYHRQHLIHRMDRFQTTPSCNNISNLRGYS